MDLANQGEVGCIGPFRGQKFMECVLSLGERGWRGVAVRVREGLVPVDGGHGVVVDDEGGTTRSQGRACRERRRHRHKGGQRVAA